MKKTLFDKVWDSHVVQQVSGGPDILFIDRHMVHEVTSPVAFLGLKNRSIPVMYPERTFATADHNTPTINQHLPVEDPLSAKQLKALEENATKHGISYWGLGHEKNGIVHVVGPEYGITQPGATIVCGDSSLIKSASCFGSIFSRYANDCFASCNRASRANTLSASAFPNDLYKISFA